MESWTARLQDEATSAAPEAEWTDRSAHKPVVRARLLCRERMRGEEGVHHRLRPFDVLVAVGVTGANAGEFAGAQYQTLVRSAWRREAVAEVLAAVRAEGRSATPDGLEVLEASPRGASRRTRASPPCAPATSGNRRARPAALSAPPRILVSEFGERVTIRSGRSFDLVVRHPERGRVVCRDPDHPIRVAGVGPSGTVGDAQALGAQRRELVIGLRSERPSGRGSTKPRNSCTVGSLSIACWAERTVRSHTGRSGTGTG